MSDLSWNEHTLLYSLFFLIIDESFILTFFFKLVGSIGHNLLTLLFIINTISKRTLAVSLLCRVFISDREYIVYHLLLTNKIILQKDCKYVCSSRQPANIDSVGGETLTYKIYTSIYFAKTYIL